VSAQGSKRVGFTIDGKEIQGEQGQTILQAAALANIYIPHLCAMRGLSPWGSCRVCTVLANGRPQAACTMPISEGMVVENDTPDLKDLRSSLVEMLFVEGNHYCMFCEKSGNCELQAVAYRLGILSPRHPYMFPRRKVDGSHPDVMLDYNRCILCARCVRASQELDGKHVFQFIKRGANKRIGVNSANGAGATNLGVDDKAAEACPVGCIIKKRVGFAVPVGQRLYDKKPIGGEIEGGQAATNSR
jgi:[NiFe] hydrogenase diaphorase moiety small subunit